MFYYVLCLKVVLVIFVVIFLIVKVCFGCIVVLLSYIVLSENLGYDFFYVFCFYVEKEYIYIL